MDWSENNSCIKCNKGGNMLVCSENGCPLAVHEGCLGSPAKLDDAGRFHCPYCLYKQAVAETRKAREYALARKKALLVFMESSLKDIRENGHHQPKSGSNVNVMSKSKSNNGGVIDQGFPVSEAEKIRNAEGDSESSAGSKAEDPSLMMNEEKGSRAAEEKRVQEEEREASVEERIQEEPREASVEEEEEDEEEEEEVEEEEEEEEIQEEQREASVEEEEIQEEEREASVEEEDIREEEREASGDEEDIEEEESETLCASNSQDSSFTAAAKRGLKRSKPMEKETEAAPVRSKFRKQHGKKKQSSPAVSTPTRRSAKGSSSAMGTRNVMKKELISPRNSTKPKETPAKLASNTPGRGKRQRLLWTEEEEAALEEAVTKYTREEKIPWRKILEESDKFHETRTPEDLRNKWRKRNYLSKKTSCS